MNGKKRPGEFELIASYFAPLAVGFPGALGLADDGALILLRLLVEALVVHRDDRQSGLVLFVLRVAGMCSLFAFGAHAHRTPTPVRQMGAAMIVHIFC